MPKRYAEFFLIDILIAIDKIKRKTSNLSFKDFVSSEDCVDAVLRNLEIIGEAVGLLLNDDDFSMGTGEDWRRIVDLRNILIHFYFGVDLEEVYGIVQEKVPSLERSIMLLIETECDRNRLLQAIQDAKADLADVFRRESIAYLEKIEKKIQ